MLARGLLERIERYAQRALTLADDFVQLARAESQTYALEPVSMTELMIDASDEVWPQAHAKRITLQTETRTETAADDGHWICADRSLMTRALVNILNNAVKYSPPDTRITCSLTSLGGVAQHRPRRRPRGTQRYRARFATKATGFPRSSRRACSSASGVFTRRSVPEVGGAGLGMAFVKTVVTRHGGDVEVVSAPGKGTAFTISLPALDEAQADVSATPRL